MQTISIVGFGALGALFASQLQPFLSDNLRIIADKNRVQRYRSQGLLVNGKAVDLNYLTPEECATPADLVLVCCKFYQLKDVLPLIASQLGEKTIIVSALNGIASEQVLAEYFGKQRIVYCVAQQMDARKEDNKLIYRDAGQLVIGAMSDDEKEQQRVQAVADFFQRLKFPHSISPNMPRQFWGKFMLNVGVNQTVALYQGTFATVQAEGEAREMFKAAMREVIAIANAEGVPLNQDDFNMWVNIMDNLDPTSMPSLRQDLLAKRVCELDLFAGTVRELGKKHQIVTPVNDQLYDGITKLMQDF
ncbi:MULTISPECIES: ketopantoate reductase family protein [unclassified Acinetobacter]|uniref:ketopantoate reductase family protein n=1 Tax=unclassified Acinetobacter TaxID=196816 RepID=UPI0035B8EA58